MKQLPKTFPWILTSTSWVLLVSQTACLKQTENETADPSVLTVGEVNNSAGFTLQIGPDVKYPAFIHKRDEKWDQDCTITEDDLSTSNADLNCVAEAQEGDLFYAGMDILYNVPSKMCAYVAFEPYWYYQYQVGPGPTAIKIEENAAGQKSLVSHTTTGGGVTLDSSYEPVCQYDYSAADGPNCCLGTYTLTTVPWDATLGTPGTPEVSGGEWGGDEGACISGSGADTQTRDSTSNLPVADLFLTEGTGLSDVYKIASPLSKSKQSNLYVANADLAAEINAAMFGARYYTFTCLDRAFEVQARIRLQIQEWNTVAEFEEEHEGDPNYGEPLGVEDPPFDNFPYNDRYDWHRFYTAGGSDSTPYPGADD